MKPVKIKISVSLPCKLGFLLISILSSAQTKNRDNYLKKVPKILSGIEVNRPTTNESNMLHGIQIQGVVGFIGSYSFDESAAETGNFYVAQFNCSNTKDESNTTVPTSQIQPKKKTLCFPNPLYDQLTVVSPVDGSFQITDNLNKVIFQENIHRDIPFSFKFPLNTNGLYMIYLLDKTGIIETTEKLIKISP